MTEQAPLRALFGGTFNPVHSGHIRAMDALHQVCGFDRVHFILSARPPHKSSVCVSIEHRFAMLQLALSDYQAFCADDTEIQRIEPSYTADTVAEFQSRFVDDRLVMIIGADSLLKLHTWYHIDDWFETVNWIVLSRPGVALERGHYAAERVTSHWQEVLGPEGGNLWIWPHSDYDVSSTRIRECLQQGTSLSEQDRVFLNHAVSAPVLDYIHRHSLYQS